jgi:hypothetical protein
MIIFLKTVQIFHACLMITSYFNMYCCSNQDTVINSGPLKLTIKSFCHTHKEICAALYMASLPSDAPSCKDWDVRHVLSVVSHIEQFSACMKCFLQNKVFICFTFAKYVLENNIYIYISHQPGRTK